MTHALFCIICKGLIEPPHGQDSPCPHCGSTCTPEIAEGFNGDHSNPEFYLCGKLVGTTYRDYELARDTLKAKAHGHEFRASIPDAKYGSMNVGIHNGQGTAVVLKADGEHATIGAVHVALIDGKLLVAIEAEPELEVKASPLILRRPRWRFYDFWRHDKEKCDNFIKPEEEWPEWTR